MNRFLILIILLIRTASAFAQTDANLAQQYMSNGEYDKAADVYKKLFAENQNGYYKSYFNCLMILEDYKEINRIIDKQIKKNPTNLTYYVDLGKTYEKQQNDKEAQKQYEAAIQKLSDNRSQATQLANAFIGIDRLDFAIKTYQQAAKIATDYSFNYELAGLYNRNGDFDLSIDTYLNYYIEGDENAFNRTTSALRQMFDEDQDHQLLQEKLFIRIQNGKNELLYTELLIWDYIQLKDFDGAIIQAKALDKRNKENGERVLEIAETARTEGAYDAAIQAYDYIIAKGRDYPFYFNARNGVLNCHKDKIFKLGTYTIADVNALRTNYETFLLDYSRKDGRAAAVISDLARLEAFYASNIQRAIELIEPVIDWALLTEADRSKYKLDLGDFYLISGDVWEATLLYSQVDKAMKDAPLGEEARFKNAKLAYYRGDFSYAQGLLDVLKASTSELVANDAMQLSVFITDNLGLDSVAAPMLMFARADLLIFQNDIPKAIATLDSLETAFPGHKLTDDILFAKAQIALKLQKTDEAVALLEKIRQEYAFDLLGDDAIFKLGELYQYQYKDVEKAKLCYEQIILNYKDSLFVTEARKRFRALRGDVLGG